MYILKKMRKEIKDVKINIKGERRTENPTCFGKINLIIAITSPDVVEEDIKRALELSEEKICPVLAMIKGNVEVNYELIIKK
jgi:putative redox protein